MIRIGVIDMALDEAEKLMEAVFKSERLGIELKGQDLIP